MWIVGRDFGRNKYASFFGRSAPFRFGLSVILIVPLLTGCMVASNQLGPERPITVDDDVAWLRSQIEQDIRAFYQDPGVDRAALRNEIVTARMYIADMEYHKYEARLTNEIQSEGLLTTATSLGLTTTASLIPVAQTSRLLSGIASGVTGLDKAYDEKQLLSNTMQALQTQMRADRKAQAAAIQAAMIDPVTKNATPITRYTLPMALSDADAYYQAGTVASALIGLSKTVANAERNADQAKSISGPNPDAVSTVKEIAVPRTGAPGAVMPGADTVKFSAPTDLSNRIRAFWRSNDANKAAVEGWLMRKGINMPVAFFLRSGQAVQQRQMIQDLMIP